MKPKDEHKRIAIRNKTLEIVLEKGIAGVKMADLAKRVGISPSTLYVYYKNKEDLIIAIFSELLTAEIENSRKEINDDLSYQSKIKSIWLHWLDFGINNFNEMNFIEQVKQSPYYEKAPETVRTIGYKLGGDLFDEGKNLAIIKNIDNQIIIMTMKSFLGQTIEMILKKELELNKRNTDLMFSLFWDAIKK